TVSGGKYVAPGVFVGAEQGTSLQSSRAKVEVDLLPHVTGYSSMGADGSNRVGLDWVLDYCPAGASRFADPLLSAQRENNLATGNRAKVIKSFNDYAANDRTFLAW